jgi:hypothetical protein
MEERYGMMSTLIVAVDIKDAKGGLCWYLWRGLGEKKKKQRREE